MVNKRVELAPKTVINTSLLMTCTQIIVFLLKDEDFIAIAKDTVKQAYLLLESSGWKTEKVTPQNDKIQTSVKSEIGKVFRLTVSSLLIDKTEFQ